MSLFDTHYAKAQEFYDEGNYEAARVALKYALDANPPANDCRAHALLAHTYRKLELDDDALQMFEYCLSHHTTADVYAELALILAEKNREHDRAEELAQYAINTDPDLASPYIALFLIDSEKHHYIKALKNLKSGLRRGAEYSEQRIFELVRAWCQDYCNDHQFEEAFLVISEIADYYHVLEFYILKAKIAELANYPRISVEYYKKALPFVRAGSLRTDILEAIAKLAI